MRDPRVTRRAFLRTAFVGGTGLAGAYLLGCDDGSETSPAATAPPGATLAPSGAPTEAAVAPGAMQWRQITPLGEPPPPRRDHGIASDGERLYVHGGQAQEPLADLWIYDVRSNAWTGPGEGGPAPRFGHNVVWDPTGEQLLLFGGQAGSDFFSDVWRYDAAASAWSELAPAGAGPEARYGAGGALDSAGRLLVTHGFTSSGRFDDTWAFGERSWSDISAAGERPLERCLIRAAWDPTKDRLLIFGGQSTGIAFLGDFWAFSDGTWTEITSEPKPSPRTFYAMTFDDVAGRLVLFGGRTEDGPANDLWFFDPATDSWSEQTPDGAPPARFGHDATVTPAGSLLMFGGTDGDADLNDLWELTPAA